MAEAEAALNENIDPPTERSEGVDHILTLLNDRKLIIFVDLKEAQAKRAAKDAAKAKWNSTRRKRKATTTVIILFSNEEIQ
jgi:hypothetical protein